MNTLVFGCCCPVKFSESHPHVVDLQVSDGSLMARGWLVGGFDGCNNPEAGFEAQGVISIVLVPRGNAIKLIVGERTEAHKHTCGRTNICANCCRASKRVLSS